MDTMSSLPDGAAIESVAEPECQTQPYHTNYSTVIVSSLLLYYHSLFYFFLNGYLSTAIDSETKYI